jgi:hypothetical protein
MNIEEVDVLVRPDGTVNTHVRGVKGNGCLAITAEMERLLGGGVTRDETAEMRETQEWGMEKREQRT